MPEIRPGWRELSPEEMKRRFLPRDVVIAYPFAGALVPVYGDRVRVQGQFDASQYHEVWAKVYRVGAAIEAPGAAPPEGSVRCHRDREADFYHEWIPGAILGNDNKIVAWARSEAGEWSGPEQVEFQGDPQATYLVSAKRCLYFAFAPDKYEGPPNSQPAPERGPLFRPVEVPVPSGAVSVHVVAQGTWGHSAAAGDQSDANGKVSTQMLQWPDYRTKGANLPEENELPLDQARLNRLVGAFVMPNSNVLTEVGLGANATVPVPPEAVKLLLAHHDGFEWSNNVGELTVAVTFSFP